MQLPPPGKIGTELTLSLPTVPESSLSFVTHQESLPGPSEGTPAIVISARAKAPDNPGLVGEELVGSPLAALHSG